MAEYKKSQSKQQMQIDDMSESEAKDKLRRLMGGGLGAARVQNELDELAEQDPEEIKDGYQLRFVGKDYARLQAGLATETVIVPNVEHNAMPENANSQNIFITGDNLDALKHLENSYTGKVDVIYIDPPYNTGSDGFVYSDNFSFSDEDLQLKLGLTKDEVRRLRSLEGKSSHSAWLTFMYPRLLIAKRLLKDSGVIFISIDDNEHANLKVLCDSLMGGNFVSNIIWQKKTGASDANDIATITEYILCYKKKEIEGLFKKNIESFDPKRYRLSDSHEALRGKYYTDNLDRGGLQYSDSMNFGIQCPDGTIAFPNGRTDFKNDGWIWKWSKKKIDWAIENDYLEFRRSKSKKSGWSVLYKNYMFSDNEGNKIERGAPYKNIIIEKILNTHGTSELEGLFGSKLFSAPKPTALIKFLLSLFENNSLILDFFSGSGTTGHAVMQLNADDEGMRRHIQVQLPELPNSKTSTGLAAINEGYRTIDEIARKRLELAAAKIRETKGDDLPANWDGGYRHFTLARASDNTLDKLEEFDPDAAFSEDMITPFAADSLDVVAASGDNPSIPVDGTASGTETLLATWLCDDGFGLTPQIQELEFAGAKAHLADSTLYVIDEGWTTASTKALINQIGTNKLSLSTIILYPYSFGFTTFRELKDSLRTNLDTDHTVGVVERF